MKVPKNHFNKKCALRLTFISCPTFIPDSRVKAIASGDRKMI